VIQRGAAELARLIAAGEFSSREVVEAHIERIEACDPQLNAVVVRCFDEALAAADMADRERRQGSICGPLHGLPITLKESFYLAGTDSTIGVSQFRRQPAEADGALVARLKAAGAIVLGKTNLPQLMFMHETDNPLFGCTNNPWDLRRSPGGSTGGEAAAVAAGESPLGLASDIGGSIRQPAHVCGICGLKPTSGRLTQSGCRPNMVGMQAIPFQSGPLARRVEDVALAMQVLVGPPAERNEWDAPPVPWREPGEVEVARLSIGFLADDGLFTPSPAIRRAVHEAAKALADCGSRVQEFVPPGMAEMLRLYFGLISADGAAELRRLLGKDKPDWRIGRLFRLARIPRLLRPAIAAAYELAGERHTGWVVRNTGPLDAAAYRRMIGSLEDYVRKFIAAMDAAEIDVLLFPPYGLPALRHGSSGWLLEAAGYCFLPNILGMPAGVVPVTSVASHEESDRPAGTTRAAREALANERGSAGLPVGVQIMARHWREDIVLAAMQAVERQRSTQSDFPRTPVIAGDKQPQPEPKG